MHKFNFKNTVKLDLEPATMKNDLLQFITNEKNFKKEISKKNMIIFVRPWFNIFSFFLFPLITTCEGDNWNGIMKDTLREECEAGDGCLRNCCVSPYFAPLFFVVFVLMAQFVLVNVVVAVLMKHLEESHKQVKMAFNAYRMI